MTATSFQAEYEFLLVMEKFRHTVEIMLINNISTCEFLHFEVFMSMVSFWLEPSAVPGRVTLGTSTWLTLITLTQRFVSFSPIWKGCAHVTNVF